MEDTDVEEKIKQKELEIIKKINQLQKNQELWLLLLKGSCLWGQCCTQGNEGLAKSNFNHIVWYFAQMNDLILEKLKKETLFELWELLVLFLDKKEIYQSVKNS